MNIINNEHSQNTLNDQIFLKIFEPKPQINIKKQRNNNHRISTRWTKNEDELLISLVEKYGTKNWKKINLYLETRTPIQCFYRWNKVLKLKQLDKPFTEDEDKTILEFVKKFGFSKWTECTKILKNRTSKQIKERWLKSLANEESLMKIWTPEDELKLLNIVFLYGTCWSKIKNLLKFKNENAVKNKFYSILRRVANQKLNLNDVKNNKTDVIQLKINDLIKYLPEAIEDIKKNGCLEDLASFEVNLENMKQIEEKSDQNVVTSNRENLVEQFNIERLKEDLMPKSSLENSLLPEYKDISLVKKMYYCLDCKETLKKNIKVKIIDHIYKKKIETIASIITDIKTNNSFQNIDNFMKIKSMLQLIRKDLIVN